MVSTEPGAGHSDRAGGPNGAITNLPEETLVTVRRLRPKIDVRVHQ